MEKKKKDLGKFFFRKDVDLSEEKNVCENHSSQEVIPQLRENSREVAAARSRLKSGTDKPRHWPASILWDLPRYSRQHDFIC